MMKNYMFPFIFSQNRCFSNNTLVHCYTQPPEIKDTENGFNPEAPKCIIGWDSNNFIY